MLQEDSFSELSAALHSAHGSNSINFAVLGGIKFSVPGTANFRTLSFDFFFFLNHKGQRN